MARGKVVAGVLGALVALVSAVVTWGYVKSARGLDRLWKIRSEPVTMAGPEGFEEGQRLFTARGCAECHGDDGGGKYVMRDTPVGSYYASNLTRGRGGLPAGYDDEAIGRAVRHCVRPDGRPLVFMTCEDYRDLSDVEVGRLVRFLRDMAPVDRDNQPQRLTLLSRMLYATGQFKLLQADLLDHERQRPEAPPPGPTVEYGKYLSATCIGCHGETLSGGPVAGLPPGVPPPSNLTPAAGAALATWTRDQFATLMRTGQRPDGTSVNRIMPWAAFARMTDDELSALHAYLKTLPPRPTGQR